MALTADDLKRIGFNDPNVIAAILKDPVQRLKYEKELQIQGKGKPLSEIVDEFVNEWKGRYLEFNGDQYKNQCMDMFWQFLQKLGVDPTPYRGWGSAKNCYKAYDKIKDAKRYFENIKNDPNAVPIKGDILFWGFYPGVTGIDGHVAIHLEGNLWVVISFGQNYPTKSPCHIQKFGNGGKIFHGYRGIMGWWRFKGQ